MKTKKSISTKKLWDESAEKWASYQQKWQSALKMLEKSLEGIKIKKNWDILDLACGHGNSTRFLAKRSPQGKIFGVDISGKMIAIAKKENWNIKNIRYIISSVEKFSTKKRFNLILVNFGFYFFKNQREIISKFYSLLKPKGLVLMTLLFPSWQDSKIYQIRKRTAAKYHLKMAPTQQITLTLLPIEKMIKNKFIIKTWRIDSRPSHPWMSLKEFMAIPVMSSNIFKGGTFQRRTQAIADLVKRLQINKMRPGYVRWQTIILKKI